MKVTNYEISKKLAEINFQADFNYCYRKGEPERGVWSKSFEVTCWDGEDISNYYPAFDFETVLEALPERLTNENIFIPRINYYLRLSKEEIWYENECDCDSDESCPVNQRFELNRARNESLADTTARLLIKLHEEGLIKFEGKDETN